MTALDAAIFLPFTLAIGIWVAWSDMKSMKIPNLAVLTLMGVWLVLGPILVEWNIWAWGLALGAMAMVVGFVGAALRLFGMGDAKFVAAMAPFFVQSSLQEVMIISAAVMLAALAAHRLWRAVPGLRALAPNWESWTHKDFPMGLALMGILNIYLGLKAASLFLA